MKHHGSREHLQDLVASCEVISEYAALADLPEVDDILSRLLFVLTDGVYGSDTNLAAGSACDANASKEEAARLLRDQFRAFGRITRAR